MERQNAAQEDQKPSFMGYSDQLLVINDSLGTY